tara:strand:+ start:338 stop:448 length:111 start_codon:yes stop_codon:yes gene_type:complete
MCWEKPKVLKYAAGFQLVGNVVVYGLLRGLSTKFSK